MNDQARHRQRLCVLRVAAGVAAGFDRASAPAQTDDRGGHVECDETQAEAAVREAAEESGLRVRLLASPSLALPQGYPHERVAAPWWITEVMVPADNHVSVPHIHVDHQYVAIADSPVPVSESAHPFGWFFIEELADLPMFDDTLLLARALFPRIDATLRKVRR